MVPLMIKPPTLNFPFYTRKLVCGHLLVSVCACSIIDCIPVLFILITPMGDDMGKRVFLSDIHISEGRTLGKANSYEWLSKEDRLLLSSFLYKLTNDDSVDEVIFLGDLFDTWVVPIDEAPLSFKAILEADCNELLLNALATVSKTKRTVYILGNHDMTAKENRNLITERIPMIEIPDDFKYDSKDGIIAKHGHEYFVFNAEEVVPGYKVPLGYYISRLAAKLTTQGLHSYFSVDVISRLLGSLIGSILGDPGTIVTNCIDHLASKVKPPINDNYQMLLDDGQSISIGEIKQRYADMFSHWSDRCRQDWNAAVGFQISNGSLNPNKCKDLILEEGYEVVIFGHTHDACVDPVRESVPGTPEERILGISANCGTWCGYWDRNQYQFVLTEFTDGEHTVKLNHWYKVKAEVKFKKGESVSFRTMRRAKRVRRRSGRL